MRRPRRWPLCSSIENASHRCRNEAIQAGRARRRRTRAQGCLRWLERLSALLGPCGRASAQQWCCCTRSAGSHERLVAVIGAVAATDRDRPLREAKAADHRLRTGTARALEGVRFPVKDWIDVEGWPISGATGSDPGDRNRRPTDRMLAGAILNPGRVRLPSASPTSSQHRTAGAVLGWCHVALADCHPVRIAGPASRRGA